MLFSADLANRAARAALDGGISAVSLNLSDILITLSSQVHCPPFYLPFE